MDDAVVAVLLTCHERREATLRCLDAIAAQDSAAAVRVFVVDAGSTDGTREALAARDVELILRGPDVFWNGGMRIAWRVARREGPDFYLWLNDDTVLDGDALGRLLACHDDLAGGAGPAPRIVVGSTRDPVDGRPTYGGVRRASARRPLAFDRVDPADRPLPVDTMNGNVVLVPADVAEVVGNLDPGFTHGMGDFDYGLRARARGVEVWLAPGTHGSCARNPAQPPARSVREAWRRLTGPKGLPLREWTRFARRHAGPLWPVYAASPYLRRLARAAG